MPVHPLTNFEALNFLKNNLNFMVVIQEIIKEKIKDRACIINLGEYESIGTHWIALHMNAENVKYFYSFGVEHVPKEIRKFIGKNITNISRIQAYDSIMCGYFCIVFVNLMLKDKSLL